MDERKLTIVRMVTTDGWILDDIWSQLSYLFINIELDNTKLVIRDIQYIVVGFTFVQSSDRWSKYVVRTHGIFSFLAPNLRSKTRVSCALYDEYELLVDSEKTCWMERVRIWNKLVSCMISI